VVPAFQGNAGVIEDKKTHGYETRYAMFASWLDWNVRILQEGLYGGGG